MTETIGLFGDDRRVDRDFFRVGALDPLVADPEHQVAHPQIGDAGTDRADHSREVPAENMRELDAPAAVGAAAEPHLVIRRIDAGGVDVDDDLAGSGDRVGDLGQMQYLRSAMLFEQHRFHGLISPVQAILA